ncbi:sarcosine oxidase subunit gamma family protein [Falsiroseomonas sp.]|uniref:sarcosine oxidase subunit gamma family protein n=1 Tax=Falsiroseomonas sp. TaxID=2870721 RepID=UPI00271ECFEB|nr:sarcosine oxidase subunit gamma family protein [Falsiroseomonas sp.]MDO9499890.1 sarcosine oxidase subunit gamma family protein [Falsiroseomonas sp.]
MAELELRGFTAIGATALHGPATMLPGLPQRPGWVAVAGATAIWAAPGTWLCLHAPGAVLPVADAHRTEVDGSRAVLELTGRSVREALATILALDLHPRAFPHGAAAATLAAQVPLLIWRDGEAFRLACARSYGESLRAALRAAGRGRGLVEHDAVPYPG